MRTAMANQLKSLRDMVSPGPTGLRNEHLKISIHIEARTESTHDHFLLFHLYLLCLGHFKIAILPLLHERYL